MPISLDLSQVSLESAAKLLEMQLGISGIRAHREKMAMSAGMQGALIGGLGGLGTGLMSSAMSTDERKRWLRNALVGTALGAGVGGAVGYGSDVVKQLQKPSPIEQNLNKTEAVQARQEAEAQPNDPIRNWLYGKPSTPAAAASGAKPARTGAGKIPSVSDLQPSNEAVGKELLNQYTGRPYTAGLTTATGVGLGHGVDKLRQYRITPDDVSHPGKARWEGMVPEEQAAVKAFQTQAKAVRAAGGHVTKPFFGGAPSFVTPPPKPNTTNARIEYKPSVAEQASAMPQPAPLISKMVNKAKQTLNPPGAVRTQFPPQTWNDDIVPAMRQNMPRKWGGKLTGGVLGLAAAPLAESIWSGWNGTN